MVNSILLFNPSTLSAFPPYNRQFEQLVADTSDVTPGEAHLAALTSAKRYYNDTVFYFQFSILSPVHSL